MAARIGGVVTGGFVNLNGWVLGINLSLNEILQMLGYAYVKTDLSANAGNFERQVFLDATRHF